MIPVPISPFLLPVSYTFFIIFIISVNPRMATPADDNRFSPITPDDHAGSVWIATLLCLVYSVVTLALRGHLRWKMYGVDDYLALAATVKSLYRTSLQACN